MIFPPGWRISEAIQNPVFSDEFAKYAKVVFEQFGEEIPLYVTINEATHNGNCSYLTGNYPPNKHDVQALVQVSYNFMVANAKAIREFRRMNFKHSQIGIVHTTNSVQILKTRRNTASLREEPTCSKTNGSPIRQSWDIFRRI